VAVGAALFCRKAQEDAVIGEQYFEIDKTHMEGMLRDAKEELKSK